MGTVDAGMLYLFTKKHGKSLLCLILTLYTNCQGISIPFFFFPKKKIQQYGRKKKERVSHTYAEHHAEKSLEAFSHPIISKLQAFANAGGLHSYTQTTETQNTGGNQESVIYILDRGQNGAAVGKFQNSREDALDINRHDPQDPAFSECKQYAKNQDPSTN